jgi:DNA-binding beta-propeller fold protein YncE
MDYIAYDREHHRVWVPAGNTGSVDVVDAQTGDVTRIEGFATAEIERNGRKRTVGPSSAAVGSGWVYVGNRGDSSVCAIDADSLAKGSCLKLDQMPDGLAYVPKARELWVTTPRDQSIVIIDTQDPAHLAVKDKIALGGAPEGFAVDDPRGVFYTNLEDKGRTLQIDARTRQVTATWLPSCGEDGPKGLALDVGRNLLIVACSDRVKVLDTAHGGKEVASLETGAGVDNIDYLESRHELYVGAARAAHLAVVEVGEHGGLSKAAIVPTANGARNPVVTEAGAAYLTDSPEGKILLVAPASTQP